VSSSDNHTPFEKYKVMLIAWVVRFPGKLAKIGGKQKRSNRPHGASHYSSVFFDTSISHVFPGTLTDSRQAGWLELMLIQFAHSLGIGVNDNHRN
jgi:hypothetical protein